MLINAPKSAMMMPFFVLTRTHPLDAALRTAIGLYGCHKHLSRPSRNNKDVF
jgi:hypothetical protein